MNKMLLECLNDAKTVAISGHVRPDGDCVGSCLGLYQYIRDNYPAIEVDVYLEEIIEVFQFLQGAGQIRHEVNPKKEYDLVVALDCGDAERLGFAQDLLKYAKKTVCIDHHISNTSFAMENYVDPEASSTSELVYRFLEESKISLHTAEALYLGIVHDTGVFQYSCTAPETMEVAAKLMRKGIDNDRLIEETFYQKTYAQVQMLGKALMESILFMDGCCIASVVTKKDMDFYGLEPKELEGIVSHLRNTKDVEVAIFLYELAPQEFKVSLRSNDRIDVSVISQYFGGGGHKKAAGFTMVGTSHDVINNVAARISVQMSK